MVLWARNRDALYVDQTPLAARARQAVNLAAFEAESLRPHNLGATRIAHTVLAGAGNRVWCHGCGEDLRHMGDNGLLPAYTDLTIIREGHRISVTVQDPLRIHFCGGLDA